MTEANWKLLLAKYIRQVGDSEGVDYLPERPTSWSDCALTQAEFDALHEARDLSSEDDQVLRSLTEERAQAEAQARSEIAEEEARRSEWRRTHNRVHTVGPGGDFTNFQTAMQAHCNWDILRVESGIYLDLGEDNGGTYTLPPVATRGARWMLTSRNFEDMTITDADGAVLGTLKPQETKTFQHHIEYEEIPKLGAPLGEVEVIEHHSWQEVKS